MSSHLLWFHFEILLSCLPLLFSSNVSLKNYCLQALRLHQLFCWAVRLHVNWGSCSLVIVLFSSSLWHTAPHCCPKRFCSLLFSLLFQTSITLMCFPHPYIGLFARLSQCLISLYYRTVSFPKYEKICIQGICISGFPVCFSYFQSSLWGCGIPFQPSEKTSPIRHTSLFEDLASRSVHIAVTESEATRRLDIVDSTILPSEREGLIIWKDAFKLL